MTKTTKLTPAQTSLLETLRNDPRALNGTQSNTHKGRTIAALVKRGVLTVTTAAVPPSRTYYGRHLDGFCCYLTVTEVS